MSNDSYTLFENLKKSVHTELVHNISFDKQEKEDWKYFPIEQILQKNFVKENSITKIDYELNLNSSNENIIFENGFLNKEKSQYKNISIQEISIEEIKKQYDLKEFDFVAQLNLSTHKSFIKISIPRTVEKVNLKYFVDSKEKFVTQCVVIDIQEGGMVNITEEHQSLNQNEYTCQNLSLISLGQKATTHYYYIQNTNDTAIQLANTFVLQEKDSYFYSFAFQLGARFSRHYLDVRQQGTHAHTYMYGLYIAANKGQVIDNNSYIAHNHPQGYSSEHYKGLVGQLATANFNGRIFVKPNAQLVDASQLNNNIVLHPTARVNSKPEINVFANDIQCTHGATIGSIDETQLFYLKSRAISTITAYQLLLHAAIEEILDYITDNDIRNYITQQLNPIIQKLQTSVQSK